MNRLVVSALLAPLLLPALAGPAAAAPAVKPGACRPSPTVLHASPTRVPGLSSRQVATATSIINAATASHVPSRGQTIAVMTALQASSLGGRAKDVLGRGATQLSSDAAADPSAAAKDFYSALTKVKGWENLPPTLAAHAAQRNLDPEVYARWWPRAVTIVDRLTSGSGVAGLQNLAARAEAVAACTAATVKGRFALVGATRYVGQFPPAALDSRAMDFARNGGGGWHDRCQHFVAVLAGRQSSGYSTALDAWQTFEAQGHAHPVTGNDGVAPPVGAWLYYRDSTNPAGHVVTYLGNGQIASTDVFGEGGVGIGPASAITNGPWRMQYLGWAAPWGQE